MSSDVTRRIAEAESRLAEVQAEIDALRAENARLESRRRALRRDLGRLGDAARARAVADGDANAELQRLQERLAQRHAALDATARDLRAIREEADAVRAECLRREMEADRLARRVAMVTSAMGDPWLGRALAGEPGAGRRKDER